MGDIGWGLQDLKAPNKIVQNVEKFHINYWNDKKS